MSNVSLVMTVLGKDRPGLVESLSHVVANHGGNWVESRMAHLAGQFAGIVRVDVAAEQSAQLTKALHALQESGLELIIHSDEAPTAPVAPPPGLVRLELIGQDRPGIISEITRVLAAHDVNVEDLATECVTAPTTGQHLFQAIAKLQLPSPDISSELQRDLEQIAGDLMIDVTIE